MKLYIKNKIISMAGHSYVKNEAGEDVYNVRGKVFSFTRKKTITDLNGNVLYKVRNKFFTFIFPKAYILDAEGNKIAKVTNDGLLGFKVVDYPDKIFVERGVKMTRSITKNGETIGYTRRNLDLMRDSFELDIKDGENVPFFVALVIAIDNMRDNAQAQSN